MKTVAFVKVIFIVTIPYMDLSTNLVTASETTQQMSDLKRELLDLFYTPMNDNYQNSNRNTRVWTTSVSATMNSILNISELCPPTTMYSSIGTNCMRAVNVLTEMLIAENTTEDFLQLANIFHRPDIHPKVWYTAVVTAMSERPDMTGFSKPFPVQIFADTFVPREAIDEFIQHDQLRQSVHTHIRERCIQVDERFGADNGIENTFWYFREDAFVNSHHWLWHTAYPITSSVPHDRRGEIFYYFHHSLVARYNAERLCNNFKRVEPLELTHGGVIEEGYNSHLSDRISSMNWTDRPPRTLIQNVYRKQDETRWRNITIDQVNQELRRVQQAIRQGRIILPSGGTMTLEELDGIDILSNIAEASALSRNPDYYGALGFHNNGHIVIGALADPNSEQMLPIGVMGDPATSIRDTVFFRWHTFTDNVIEDFRNRLPAHTPTGGTFPLSWPGVTLSAFRIRNDNYAWLTNRISTFWNVRKFRLRQRLDFREQGFNSTPISVCQKHLNHDEFTYRMTISRRSFQRTQKATVRIYIAPRFDEDGNRFKMEEQRRLFFALDIFSVNLPAGQRTVNVQRSSLNSTLTIRIDDALRVLESNDTQERPFCGCGWPHHLLIPKGSRTGTTFDIFAMVTDGSKDDDFETSDGSQECRSAFIYCGLQNRKYPDSKPMGYPFDRVPYESSNELGGSPHVENLDDYMRGITNMDSVQVKVVHKNIVVG